MEHSCDEGFPVGRVNIYDGVCIKVVVKRRVEESGAALERHQSLDTDNAPLKDSKSPPKVVTSAARRLTSR